jgi:hypothetical protein
VTDTWADLEATVASAKQRILDLRRRNDELVRTLKELRSATIAFRNAAYDAEPTLVVRNDVVNVLSAFLVAADKAIARDKEHPL